MKRCDHCDEPAAKTVSVGTGEAIHTNNYCHVHAAENGLLDLPLDDLEQIATKTGYPVNAIMFVSETIARVDNHDLQKKLCHEILETAKARFGNSAQSVFSDWKILDKSDIRKIVSGLLESEMIETNDHTILDELEKPITLMDLLDAT